MACRPGLLRLPSRRVPASRVVGTRSSCRFLGDRCQCSCPVRSFLCCRQRRCVQPPEGQGMVGELKSMAQELHPDPTASDTSGGRLTDHYQVLSFDVDPCQVKRTQRPNPQMKVRGFDGITQQSRARFRNVSHAAFLALWCLRDRQYRGKNQASDLKAGGTRSNPSPRLTKICSIASS